MKDDARERGRASFFGPLLRGQRRIAIDRREMMADIPVGEMLEIAAEQARLAVERD